MKEGSPLVVKNIYHHKCKGEEKPFHSQAYRSSGTHQWQSHGSLHHPTGKHSSMSCGRVCPSAMQIVSGCITGSLSLKCSHILGQASPRDSERWSLVRFEKELHREQTLSEKLCMLNKLICLCNHVGCSKGAGRVQKVSRGFCPQLQTLIAPGFTVAHVTNVAKLEHLGSGRIPATWSLS